MVKQADRARSNIKDTVSEKTDIVVTVKESTEKPGTVLPSDLIEMRAKDEAAKGAKAAVDHYLIPFEIELRAHLKEAVKYDIKKSLEEINDVLDQLQPLLEVYRFLKELKEDFSRMPECFITTSESSDPPINIYFNTTPDNPTSIEVELLDRFHILSEKIKFFEIKFPCEAYESANNYFAEIVTQLEFLAVKVFDDKLNNILSALSLQQEALKKGFIAKPATDNILREVINSYCASVKFEKQSCNIAQIEKMESERAGLETLSAISEDLTSKYPNPDNLTISDLPENLKRQAESRAAKYAKAAEDTYRASDEARSIKLLREISEISPDTSRINKLVKQLSKTGCDRVCEILWGLSERLEVKSEHIIKISALFAEQKEVAAPVVQISEVKLQESEILPPAPEVVSEPDPGERELVELILDDFGITDPAARQKLVEASPSEWLIECAEMMTGLNPDMINELIKINPELLNKSNPDNFSFFVHTLKETISYCSGLESYEVFDPLKHPLHFSSMNYLSRTKKAAKLLIDTINDLKSVSFREQSSEILKNDKERITRMISLSGIDGQICVAAVLDGFYVDGVLATLPRKIKDEHIRRNLPAELAASRKSFLKVMKKLEDRNVVILVGGKKSANLWYSLQIDPSLVAGDEFRELLLYALETRTRK